MEFFPEERKVGLQNRK